MESSILNSTKKILGVPEDYTAFDLDIITHINAALSTLHQLGVGPIEGLFIEDAENVWDELELSGPQLNLARSYIYLKTRMLFDPPTTSFLLEAMNDQITQFEWRLNVNREEELHPLGELT